MGRVRIAALTAFREPLAAQTLLLAQENVWQAAARTARRNVRQGDWKILSKDKMISRSKAEVYVQQLTPQVEQEQAAGPCRARRTAPAPITGVDDSDDKEDGPDAAPDASLEPLPALPPPPPPAAGPSQPSERLPYMPGQLDGFVPWPPQHPFPLQSFSPHNQGQYATHTHYQPYPFYHYRPPHPDWSNM